MIPGVGIDMLLKDGKLDHYKAGPVYWVDSSDVHPRIGSASAAIWRLNCLGRLSHSGLPHKVKCMYIVDGCYSTQCNVCVQCNMYCVV